jgi:hypothetical protein
LIAKHGLPKLARMLGPSCNSLARAAGGCRVVLGTRVLIASGIERLQAETADNAGTSKGGDS